MRKELLVMLCTIGLLVGGATMANATTVTWTIMQDAGMAGAGPGADLLLGTGDDSSSGQNNSCNLTGNPDCTSGGTPWTGSWSYIALELPQATSCNGGTDPGQGGCTTNEDCGTGGICLTCPENGSGYDTFSYMGNVGCALGTGTLRACQVNGTFFWQGLKIGASESVAAGLGGSSINLNPIGSISGASSGCGLGSWTSQANIGFWDKCNPTLHGGQIDNLALNGRVYDASTDIAAADCQCYPKTTAGAADLNAIRAAAAGKGASYLLVLCGNTSIPNDSTTTSVCLRGASVWYAVVAYTEDDASSCTDPNIFCMAPYPPGPCAGGIAECGSGM